MSGFGVLKKIKASSWTVFCF